MEQIKKHLTTITLLFLLLCSFNSRAESPFITRWNLPASAFVFPGIGTHYTIEWEQVNNPQVKGVIEDAGTQQVISVPANGEYRIKAYNGSGVLSGFSMTSDNYARLLAVEQWGTIQWTKLDRAFNTCINMDVTATDVPDLSQVTSLSNMFVNCSKLVGNASFERWNTASVRDMSWMFAGATLFNQDISGWNTENVTTMRAMFQDAKMFNQPIGSWDTRWVGNMDNMFYGAEQFNQPIGSWNTGSVTRMTAMFANAKAFNQPIGDWNMENIISIDNMFLNATKFNQNINSWNTIRLRTMTSAFSDAAAFNQSIGNWSLQSVALTDKRLLNVFAGTAIDCENYAATLAGWADNPRTPDGVLLDASGLNYNATAIPIRDRLIHEKGWTINNDQYTAVCGVLPVTFGPVTALRTGNGLLVTWKTMQETACDHFVIQASADGKEFIAVGTLKSKSRDGNSREALDYTYTIPLWPMASMLPMTLLTGFLFKRRKRLLLYCVGILTVWLWMGCSRNHNLIPDTSLSYKFIRIAQADKDQSGYRYSKIITIQESPSEQGR